MTYNPNRRRPRAPYTQNVIRKVKRRLANGELQHDIAADLGWNQGRISEIKNGRRGSDR
jgi:hypothetical protein